MADTTPHAPADVTTGSVAPATTGRVDGPSTSAPTGLPTDGTTPGRTVVADAVVAKVAGIAAREVPGVHALGGGAARAFGAIRDVVGSTDLGQGVRVEVGETQVAADVTIVVEYPVAISRVADEVRLAVATAIEQLVGMDVAEVNVAVADVHVPGEDDDDQPAARAR
jgi:uncharacterized alkaline shock family protein YloU